MNRTEGLSNMTDVFVLNAAPLYSIVGVQLSLKICEQEVPGLIQLLLQVFLLSVLNISLH